MNIFSKLLSLLVLVSFISCESAEDISFGLDHKVPEITFSSEKTEVKRGEQTSIDIFVSDEAGLSSVDVSYSGWGVQSSKKLDGQVDYSETLTIEVPSDALLEWEETKYRNDGSAYTEIETYHKFTVTATDVNLNKRKSYFYIKALE